MFRSSDRVRAVVTRGRIHTRSLIIKYTEEKQRRAALGCQCEAVKQSVSVTSPSSAGNRPSQVLRSPQSPAPVNNSSLPSATPCHVGFQKMQHFHVCFACSPARLQPERTPRLAQWPASTPRTFPPAVPQQEADSNI